MVSVKCFNDYSIKKLRFSTSEEGRVLVGRFYFKLFAQQFSRPKRSLYVQQIVGPLNVPITIGLNLQALSARREYLL